MIIVSEFHRFYFGFLLLLIDEVEVCLGDCVDLEGVVAMCEGDLVAVLGQCEMSDCCVR